MNNRVGIKYRFFYANTFILKGALVVAKSTNMLLSECFLQLKRYKEDWLRDDLSIFGEFSERIGIENLLAGLTYARAYFILNGKRIRKRNKELIRKRVLRNRKLIYSMAYWLKLLMEENIKGKLREEITVRFWVNMPYAVSHWFIAWKVVKENKSYYLNKPLKELQSRADFRVVSLAQKTIAILKAKGKKKISPDAGSGGDKVFLRSGAQIKHSGISYTRNDKKGN